MRRGWLTLHGEVYPTTHSGQVCLADHAVSNQKPPSASPPPWAEHLYRALLVGPGSPGSASAWLGFRGGDRGLLVVFTDNVHLGHLTRHTRVPNVDIVPGSPWLIRCRQGSRGRGRRRDAASNVVRPTPEPLGLHGGRRPAVARLSRDLRVRRVSVAAHPCRDPRHGARRIGGPTAKHGTRAGATEP